MGLFFDLLEAAMCRHQADPPSKEVLVGYLKPLLYLPNLDSRLYPVKARLLLGLSVLAWLWF